MLRFIRPNFDSIWENWPKQDSPGAAQRQWKYALKDAVSRGIETASIVNRAKNYVEGIEDVTYCKQLGNWLKDGDYWESPGYERLERIFREVVGEHPDSEYAGGIRHFVARKVDPDIFRAELEKADKKTAFDAIDAMTEGE